MHIDLDELEALAKNGGNDFYEQCTPEVVVHLIGSIRTLMDEDSLLAAQQRVSKSALDGMMKARKERDHLSDFIHGAAKVLKHGPQMRGDGGRCDPFCIKCKSERLAKEQG
jgi:hypothetical protein